MAGGIRHSASSRAPVPTVTLAPIATLVTAISTTAVNQTWSSFERVISSFSMMSLSA
jgi:hypothetical protein